MFSSSRIFVWIAALALALLNSPIAISQDTASATTMTAAALPLVQSTEGTSQQALRLSIKHGAGAAEAVVQVQGKEVHRFALANGDQSVDVFVPAVTEETKLHVDLDVGSERIAACETIAKPVRAWKVYLLPHSHVDIGYTKLQTEVEADQCAFIDQAIEAAKRTATYPTEAQFKWNTEVMWAVDAYLRGASDEKRAAFIDAVKKGSIELNALYGNELTALCRPEELVRLTSFACRVRNLYDVPIESAMISDVPGYTWGIVPILAGSGVKYFSIGPNRGDRIGFTLEEWGDKPFYWKSPSGEEKILCWVAAQGYSWFHRGPLRNGDRVIEYLQRLEETKFPYDIVQLRYNIGGDNGPPDPDVCDFVKDWNSRYSSPQLIVSTATEMFRAFEEKYSAVIPTVTGDFTPYWEDGAASSAIETGLNRAAAERLTQAETLWSILAPKNYPIAEFQNAWRNVVLYDEHTWGAHNSISEPDSEFVLGQWRIKQAFAVDAERQSRELMHSALTGISAATESVEALLLLNTSSWPRTELVRVPNGKKRVGDRVTDKNGKPVPCQVLSTGELVFVAADVPPFGSKRFHLTSGPLPTDGAARAEGVTLSTSRMRLTLDETTGAISSMMLDGNAANLVDTSKGPGLNEYLYVAGKDPAAAKPIDSAKIEVKEQGPLVASLTVTSTAPGCKSISTEIQVVDGFDFVSIDNRLDKLPIRDKEGVHIAYPFHAPGGVMRMDTPWAIVRPETDQLPGSCKNWFTVQRWVDVSNDGLGVTWVTLDAPLVEVGAITAETPWMKTIEPSQKLYSYVMNNYWHTNYKAYQDGITLFRYAIRPHGPFDAAAAHRFAIERSQPLVVAYSDRNAKELPSALTIDASDVLLTTLKRSEDGSAYIARVMNPTSRSAQVNMKFRNGGALYLSDLTERKLEVLSSAISVPSNGVRSIRIE